MAAAWGGLDGGKPFVFLSVSPCRVLTASMVSRYCGNILVTGIVDKPQDEELVGRSPRF